jgi:hypothetical protein
MIKVLGTNNTAYVMRCATRIAQGGVRSQLHEIQPSL